ncbi:hypothetical protein H8891_02835 [Paeniclostridium sp. NSJ-45]|uniref:Uncharacterized protein n=1 Tax=Paeniclostridium hominis TaxID=2764329 RepID=A0ABR7K0T8_9FIRM|nr:MULTISPECIES: hypothetical protein [Paeniclostridium]MBC6002723.1 hypothetical protein [Paeniclostridium hominis]
MENKNKKHNTNSLKYEVYNNLFLNNLDTISGESDNASKNLYLYLNLDKIKKHIKNR